MRNSIPKPPIDPLFDTDGEKPRPEDGARQGTADPSVPASPGEGVTEEQVEESGLD